MGIVFLKSRGGSSSLSISLLNLNILVTTDATLAAGLSVALQ